MPNSAPDVIVDLILSARRNAWPIHYSLSALNAAGNDVAVGELVLGWERIEIQRA